MVISPEPGRAGVNLSGLRPILALVGPYKARLAAAIAALLFTAAATLSIGQGLRALIDDGIGGGDPSTLERALLGLLAVGMAIAIGAFMRFYLMTWLGERVVADLRDRIFDKIIVLDVGFFEATRTGELLSRLTTDTALLQTIVGSSFSMALRNAILMIGAFSMMFVTNAKLALISALIVPVVVVPVLYFGRRVRRLSRESQDRVADVGAFAEESFNAIRTVKAFGQEQANRTRFGREVAAAFEAALVRTRYRSFLTATVTIVTFAGLGTVLWVGGGDVLAGRTSGGELGAFLFYAVMVCFSAGILSEVVGDLQRAAGATERLSELLAVEPSVTAPTTPVPLPEAPAPGTPVVAFRNVGFSYPSRPGTPTISGIDLAIDLGRSLALVGPSGAGKSTLFQLLLRFYDPTSGTIEVNGVDLTRVDPAVLRGLIAIVPQDPFIFGTDAMENIRYGRPDATDDEVVRAAKSAMADEFIADLPQGYRTFLGEKGVRLSGGQKQRVAIARAIIKNPPILLLDEATSALDSENERLVQLGLANLTRDRTTLVIAHRLSTAMGADEIAVMDAGRIVARGRHGDLVETSPLYRRYAELQLG